MNFSRVSSIKALTCIALLAPLSFAHAAKKKEFCESLLASQIQKLIEGDAMVTIAGDSYGDEDVSKGLPRAENLRAATDALSGSNADEVHFISDLGPTTWKRQDLEEWLGLSRFQIPPRPDFELRDYSHGPHEWEQARDQLLSNAYYELRDVIANPNCNLPGLSEEACEILRVSYGALREAYRKAYSGPRDLVLGFPSRERNPRELLFDEIFQKLKQEKSALNFPWKFDRENGYIYFDGFAAQRDILPFLMRERLIRHLDLMGPDGQMRHGSDLPLETRMAAATLPYLVPLLPIFLHYSLTLPDDFIMGGDSGPRWVLLYEIDVPTMFKELKFKLNVYHNGEVDEIHWVSLSSREEFEELDDQRKRVLSREITAWLTTLAKEFNSRFRQTSRSIGVIQSRQEPYRFTVNGILDQDQILFYAYVLEQSKK